MPQEKCEAMGPDWKSCPKGAIHDTEINELKRRMELIEKAVLEIRDKLLQRPSWTVSILLTALTTVCTGLAIYVITKL